VSDGIDDNRLRGNSRARTLGSRRIRTTSSEERMHTPFLSSATRRPFHIRPSSSFVRWREDVKDSSYA
jgi:hypothetical protein